MLFFLLYLRQMWNFKGPVTQNLTKFVNWPPNWATLTHKNNHRLKLWWKTVQMDKFEDDETDYNWSLCSLTTFRDAGFPAKWRLNKGRHFIVLGHHHGGCHVTWKGSGQSGMSASAFSRRAAGNLQNVVVFRRLRGFLHLGRKILEGGSS